MFALCPLNETWRLYTRFGVEYNLGTKSYITQNDSKIIYGV